MLRSLSLKAQREHITGFRDRPGGWRSYHATEIRPERSGHPGRTASLKLSQTRNGTVPLLRPRHSFVGYIERFEQFLYVTQGPGVTKVANCQIVPYVCRRVIDPIAKKLYRKFSCRIRRNCYPSFNIRTFPVYQVGSGTHGPVIDSQTAVVTGCDDDLDANAVGVCIYYLKRLFHERAEDHHVMPTEPKPEIYSHIVTRRLEKPIPGFRTTSLYGIHFDRGTTRSSGAPVRSIAAAVSNGLG